ncbi:MAG: diguanylate cyclase [Sulfuricurvum sp.]|uniref:diguanylate cyclase domain-containing protein n=1 Tax=Sulfuricurvum sp. TaxID=2025608 RepID=UPI00261C0544|nr:diguanylate cyclase [Sulfuricurvum sp.]MDD5160366.1 diguanylate cyclase [Sulfuricurvum sp.]
MKIAPLPQNEQERLAELRKYNILDTEPEAVFESMVQLASYICKTPIAAISLVDENRQWFKAIVGIDAKETPRDVAFCAHAILQDEPMVVPNALLDERFHDNPLVTDGPGIRFYAGVPLVTPSGLHLGTLCVIDTEAREIAQEQLAAVKTLADGVMAHLDLRLSHKEIRKYVNELQLSATIFETASENIVLTDHNNCFITVNPAFTATTGYSLEEIKGMTPKVLSSGMQNQEFYAKMWDDLNTIGRWDGELWNKRKNGELYAEWLSIKVIYNQDGSVRMYLAIFSDITEKKEADELIWKQANYDLLTNLPNRRLFSDRLEHEIKIAHRTNRSLALLFIDLDHFKQVNDTLGHEMGDMLLINVSERINESVRESDTVARMGGDEFTAILPQIDSLEDAERVVKIIIEKLAQPFDLNGTAITVSASVGVAIYPKDALNSKALLQNADKAMYDAKRQGRSRFFSFQQTSPQSL